MPTVKALPFVFYKLKQILCFTVLLNLFSITVTQAASFQSNVSAPSNLFGKNSSPRFLPVEEAFQMTASLTGQQLILQWDIAPEHYLYQSRFSLTLLKETNKDSPPQASINEAPNNSTELQDLEFSASEPYQDEYFGEVQIYRTQAQISATVHASPSQLQQGIQLKIRYQGCADAGLCYPPQVVNMLLIPQ